MPVRLFAQLLPVFTSLASTARSPSFITCHLFPDGSPCHFIGTHYWYGSLPNGGWHHHVPKKGDVPEPEVRAFCRPGRTLFKKRAAKAQLYENK